MSVAWRQRGPVALAIAAVAFGCVLRWWRLPERSLWYDEGYTAWVASMPVGRVVDAIRVDTAPPLYYVMLRGWVLMAGAGDGALRVPSAACSTLALGVMVAVVRRLFANPWARTVAVALVACSFLQVAYAHEARFYAMIGLAGAADFYLVLRACGDERRSAGWLLPTAIVAAASLWLNNIMLVYLGGLGVAWMVVPGRRPTRGRLADAAAVMIVAALAFAPWVPSLLGQMRAIQTDFWSHQPSASDLADVLSSVSGVIGPWGKAAAVGLAAGAACAARRRWRLVASLAAFGLLPVLLTFAYSQFRTSIFMERAFIVSSLTVPLLAAVPLEATAGRPGRTRVLAAVGVGVVLGGSVFAAVLNRYRTADHEEDWRRACRYAAAEAGPGALVVFNGNEGELLYDHYARQGDYTPSPDLTGTPADYFALRPPRTMRRVRTDDDVSRLRTMLSAAPRAVVFVAAHTEYADPGGRTLSLLRRALRQTDEKRFPAVTVYRFEPVRR